MSGGFTRTPVVPLLHPLRAALAAVTRRAGEAAIILVLPIAILAMGVFLCMRGIEERGISADLDRRGVPAAATVVAVEHKSVNIEPSGGLQEWTVITVAFTDARRTARRATQEGQDATQVGDRLRITYDPQIPTHVRWDTSITEWPFDLFGGALSLVVEVARHSGWARRRQAE